MRYEVVFTPESEETFDLISDQLLENWGLKTVIKFQQLTSIYVEKIAINPFQFQVIEEMNNIRRCNIHANCAILYHIDNDRVQIVCFWDNRQNPIFL
ncbi:type II toxin-antitoxin system RelE/ParE family toxin [Pedobacter sp. Leaf250]|uniref:type II toxin-antitoxin system RelE/ParE family toxin n=1 Tax=Pedobacter sp. Leaf250 TaxID=2876559 RepID=UPI001E2C245F|nr:hypothetical protein [Pedobacter sp. Leaf250]